MNLDIPLPGRKPVESFSAVLIDDRFVFLEDDLDASLIAAYFVCWPSGLYTISADSAELWSGRNALAAGLEWLDVSGSAIPLADILRGNLGEVSP